MKTQSFYKWVSKNNPPDEKQYGKGWWDTIEFIYKIAKTEPRVISTFVMETPPPTETLLIPIVLLKFDDFEIVLKSNFGWFPNEWLISVKRKDNKPIALFDLVTPIDKPKYFSRVPKAWQFGHLNANSQKFSGMVRTEDELFALIWILEKSSKNGVSVQKA